MELVVIDAQLFEYSKNGIIHSNMMWLWYIYVNSWYMNDILIKLLFKKGKDVLCNEVQDVLSEMNTTCVKGERERIIVLFIYAKEFLEE